MPRLPYPSRLRPLLLAAALAALAPVACTTAPRPAPPPPPQGVDIAADQYEHTFHTTVETLRRSGFRIDRADYRFGMVTTAPEGSPTLFEPWKTGNTNHHTRVLSTLNDVRRTVTVTFSPATVINPLAPGHTKSGPNRLMSVTVDMQQRDTPQRRLNGRADGSVFTDPELPGSADPDTQPSPWIPIGRDPGLETQLLQRILAQLGTP